LHFLKVPVLPLAIKALIHFWDRAYFFQLCLLFIDYLLFQNYTLITKTLYAFRKSESGLSINSQTHCIENNWPNFDKIIIAMDEKEYGKQDIEEFTKLVE
jgi:hypothetical protein